MKRNAAALAVLLAALGLLVYGLDSAPGLNIDEAWAGLRAHEIAQDWSFRRYGMTSYTGALHTDLLAPFGRVFGWKVLTLRALSVAANVSAAAILALVVRKLFGPRAAFYSLLALASSAFFQIYSRIATEAFALNPLIAVGICAALVLPEKRRIIHVAAAGVFCALGVWNHVIFAAFPLALVLTAFFARRDWLDRSTVKHALLATGVALAIYLPLAIRPILDIPPEQGLRIHAMHQAPGRLAGFPKLVAQVLNGDRLYLHYAGEITGRTMPIPAIVLGLSILLLTYLVWRGDRRLRAFVVFFFFLAGLTAYFVPILADRYTLLVVWCASVAIGIAFAQIETLGPRAKKLVPAFAILLALFTASRTVRYFHRPHLETGGSSVRFVSGDFMESSEPYLRSDRLYEALLPYASLPIQTQWGIMLPLKFYDLEHRKLRWWPDGNELRKDYLELHFRLDFEGRGEPIAGGEFRILKRP